MALPVVSEKKISSFVRSDIEKALATLPQEGSDVRFDPIAVEKALQKDDMFIQPAIDPFTPLPVVNAPIVAPIQEARTIVPALTPPITKEVIIAPPMAVQTSSVLPLLAAGAILLMQ